MEGLFNGCHPLSGTKKAPSWALGAGVVPALHRTGHSDFLLDDTNQIGVAWLDIFNLNKQPLYPSKLRRQIMNFYEGKPYITYLGNEEIGDEECCD